MSNHSRVWSESAVLCLLAGLSYYSLFYLNQWFFSGLEHQNGVNWIFLPSGVRVAFVLVMGWRGALGIMFGIWAIELEENGTQALQAPISVINGIIGGWVPWVAKCCLLRHLQQDANLRRLTAPDLLQFTLLACIGTSAMHQLNWLLFHKQDTHFWIDVWPMFIGDVLGALLILYGLKSLLTLVRFRPPMDPI